MWITLKLNKHKLVEKAPLFIYHLLFFLVFFANFIPGKYFIGWDSLNPELNFGINFKRVFTAFWQENYGVGLLGGHGFAATLPHTIITYILSFLMPNWAIRQVFTLLCFYVGGLGMYFLIHRIVSLTAEKKQSKHLLDYAGWIALFAALYYQYNLGTAQQFYVQLEAFIGYFALLPWLFWSVYTILEVHLNKKTWIQFVIITFFSTLQGFIPPLFITYGAGLGLFLLSYLAIRSFKFSTIKKCITILFVTLCINSYWLIPFTYYGTSLKQNYISSYNNMTSTNDFNSKSAKYGDLSNVALIKGFYLDANVSGSFMFQPWINHYTNNATLAIGYGVFALAVLGFGITMFSRNKQFAPFILPALFFFTGIAVNTPPFSFITQILQEVSPTYKQAFRIAFTKYSFGVAFCYSIFFAATLTYFFHHQSAITKIVNKKVALILLLLGIIYFESPYFSGALFYKQNMLKLPQTYTDIINYFKDKEDGRIADFPQACPEGWYTYKWGYFGSGFFWYGIKQPFLSRTFDVWSKYNENYYWEINQALLRENYDEVDAIMQKYGAKWALYDTNILNCKNQKIVFSQERLLEHFKTSPNYTLEKQYEENGITPVYLYSFNKDIYSSYVAIKQNIPNVQPPYTWNDQDKAYLEHGDYETSSNVATDIYYPFRSLFSKRGSGEPEFSLTSNNGSYILTSTIPCPTADNNIFIPNIEDAESINFAQIRIRKKDGLNYELILYPYVPTISLNDQTILQPYNQILGEFTSQTPNLKVAVNSENLSAGQDGTYTTVLQKTNNKIQIYDDEMNEKYVWEEATPLIKEDRKSFLQNLGTSQCNVKIVIPKIEVFTAGQSTINSVRPVPCNELEPNDRNTSQLNNENGIEVISLTSKNSDQCLNVDIPQALTKLGYILEIPHRHISGNPLSLSIMTDKKITFNTVPLAKNTTLSQEIFIVPPTYQYDIGYTISLENNALNSDSTINEIADIKLKYFPYDFLKSISISSNALATQQTQTQIQVIHNSETQYQISTDSKIPNKSTLILSQGFHDGWKAYYVSDDGWFNTNFPFFYGTEMKDHILVNNWANGWKINNPNAKNVVIIFLPQYLEFVGFGLLIGAFIVLLIRRK